ncbi:alpha/beta hydrolase, partial [Rhizobiaceae sp. 2RAB30]
MSALAEEADWPREIIDRDYGARGSVTSEVFEAAMRDYRSRSEEMRDHASHLDVVYDEASGQTVDIYGAGAEPRPVFVFIHGGYWRMLSKHDSAFMAGMLARHGIATAVVDYRLAPEVSLDEIVREVRA